MPITLQSLTADIRELPVQLPQGVLNVSYKPSSFTVRLVTQHKAAAIAGREVEALAEVLGAVLVGWDLTDGKKALLANAESLAGLPLFVLGEIWRAVQGDMSVPQATSGIQAGGSAPTAASGSPTPA